MAAIMDVGLPIFQRFRRDNPVFFWQETDKSFILLKPHNDAWLRTIVYKTGQMSDFIWRDNNLHNQTGSFQVEKVTGLEDDKILRSILLELRAKRK